MSDAFNSSLSNLYSSTGSNNSMNAFALLANIPNGGGQQRLQKKSITVHGITVALLPS